MTGGCKVTGKLRQFLRAPCFECGRQLRQRHVWGARGSSFTRPFFRLPHAAQGEWVYLFDVLTASPFPGPNDAYAQAMLAGNRGWFEAARDAGGTRYPIGAVEFNHADWQQHYGESWSEFAKRKQRFDPDNILSPGSGIFPWKGPGSFFPSL